MSDPLTLTLVVPPGAADAPISQGDRQFQPYREDGRSGRWLVDVPADVALHLCWNGGFYLLNQRTAE